jgi:hypothetical protein
MPTYARCVVACFASMVLTACGTSSSSASSGPTQDAAPTDGGEDAGLALGMTGQFEGTPFVVHAAVAGWGGLATELRQVIDFYDQEVTCDERATVPVNSYPGIRGAAVLDPNNATTDFATYDAGELKSGIVKVESDGGFEDCFFVTGAATVLVAPTIPDDQDGGLAARGTVRVTGTCASGDTMTGVLVYTLCD